MSDVELPIWLSLLLVALTVGVMAATAYWVERRYGADRFEKRKVWVMLGSVVGVAVLSVDFLIIKLWVLSL